MNSLVSIVVVAVGGGAWGFFGGWGSGREGGGLEGVRQRELSFV